MNRNKCIEETEVKALANWDAEGVEAIGDRNVPLKK